MLLTRRLRTLAALLAGLAASASTVSAEPQGTPAPAGCTGPASATWLHVVASGLRNGNGLLAVTLYADIPSKFLVHHGAMYVGRVQAVAGTTNACIFLPQPGVYAIALYHDENANQKFDRTGIGLPAEGYGFSNNPPTLVGLPSFRSVRLSVPRSGLTTRITMKYP
jgi:uncharacterized protein (DUF2141 family)